MPPIRISRHSPRRHAGFTMLELIVVVAVIAIGTAVAVPAFSDVIATQRVRAVATSLQISLMRARSEATKRNASVRVVPVGGEWKNGWQVRDNTNAVVEAQDPVPGARITSGAISVVYQASGRLQPGNVPSFSIATGREGDEKYRCVVVDLSGRAYVKEESC